MRAPSCRAARRTASRRSRSPAGACGLNCDHCQAKILAPMLPATSPEMLDRKVRELIAIAGPAGLSALRRLEPAQRDPLRALLSGRRAAEARPSATCGSRFTPRSRTLAGARAMEAAGVDTAMMDVIGADATIREVYHLDRPVADFEATLAALCATSMQVTPHIVIGLHYGRILGEAAALDIVSRHPVSSLVLVVVMPFYAVPGSFRRARHGRRRARSSPRRARGLQAATCCWAAPGRPACTSASPTRTRCSPASTASPSRPTARSRWPARSDGRVEQQHACCSIKLGAPRRAPAVGACCGRCASNGRHHARRSRSMSCVKQVDDGQRAGGAASRRFQRLRSSCSRARRAPRRSSAATARASRRPISGRPGVYLPNNNTMAPHMRSPEYVQLSTAAAMTLGIMPGRMHRCDCTRCLNLLLTYPEGCRANCAYCGLARHREAERDYADRNFIRVDWPAVPMAADHRHRRARRRREPVPPHVHLDDHASALGRRHGGGAEGLDAAHRPERRFRSRSCRIRRR